MKIINVYILETVFRMALVLTIPTAQGMLLKHSTVSLILIKKAVIATNESEHSRLFVFQELILLRLMFVKLQLTKLVLVAINVQHGQSGATGLSGYRLASTITPILYSMTSASTYQNEAVNETVQLSSMTGPLK